MNAAALKTTRGQDIATIQSRLKAFKAGGGKFTTIEKETGISRTAISQLANHGLVPTEDKLTTLVAWLNVNGCDAALTSGQSEPDEAYVKPALGIVDAPVQPTRTRDTNARQDISLYPLTDFKKMMAWCMETKDARRIGTITGESGTGKTTALKEFVRQTPGARYIDCWPTMKVGDLLNAISGRWRTGQVQR